MRPHGDPAFPSPRHPELVLAALTRRSAARRDGIIERPRQRHRGANGQSDGHKFGPYSGTERQIESAKIGRPAPDLLSAPLGYAEVVREEGHHAAIHIVDDVVGVSCYIFIS